MEKPKMILIAEEKLAREVTLGVIVTRPLTVWHYIIPGMFIIDFLRRGSALKKYTENFLFPRKLAVDAAQALAQGEPEADVFEHIENDTRVWLNSLDLYSTGLLQAQVGAIKLLADHYGMLLKEDGLSVYALMKAAYQNQENLQTFFEELTAAEAEVDRELLAKKGENEKLKEKILAEQKQLEERRAKIIEEVF
ncbi:MAG: NF038143 family protein [Desulfobacterales bacterium]|nr:NF038143 family protein [Desulfobacterales bacterium]